jgi:hypothetical protein
MSARWAAALAASVAIAAGCQSGSRQAGDAKSPFWTEREAEYRADARGPFTAIHASYLARGDSLALWAHEDSVRTAPGGSAAVQIRWDEDWGFTIWPIEGFAPPTLDGEPVETGAQVGDGSGVRLGHYLFSFDRQPPDLGRVLVHDPRRLASFHGFPVFSQDARFTVVAKMLPGGGDRVALGTTRGLVKQYVRAALLEFELDGTRCRLTGFRAAGEESDALFVPFTDATSGGESYGIGRYLRVEHAAGSAEATIDFHRATNPWCAYSPFYNCVLPPEENRLAVAIRAGERAPESH